MYPRRQTLPERSFFLFGPRGTGKSTWLRQALPEARWYDLVRDAEVVQLARDPGRFAAEVAAARPGWIVVDEVQRLPSLLGDVHDLLTRHPDRWRFALTGSSARRLRRDGADLLPGRVVNRRFFPLVTAELREHSKCPDPDDILCWGGLPAVRKAPNTADRAELLEAYVENYIGQEIRIEAAVKRLEPFIRFLEVAGRMNGQVVNTTGLGRDASVSRTTVQGYLEVLRDTLIAVLIPAWRARHKVKEVAHPKLYFFDPGVVRALSGRAREPLHESERGALLETWLLHELRAFIDHSGCGGEITYWATPSGGEVDFVWRRGDRAIGIEVKASRRWRPEYTRSLRELLASGTLVRGVVVYLGDVPLRSDGIDVLPLPDFLASLGRGELLS